MSYKIKEIGEIITGNTPNKKISEFYDSKDINFYTPSDFKENCINELNESLNFISNKAKEKARIIPKGSLLVTCIGIIGKVGIIKKDSAFNQQINAIIPKENLVINKYLAYWFLSKSYILQKKANAPVVPILNKTNFQELDINIPSIERQVNIVKKLDEIQEQININKKQIELLNELTKSQFVKMFQSGNYPKDKLGKICDVRDGTHDSPKYLEESEYKFITSKNIVNNEINFSEAKYISKQSYDKFNARSKVNYGDILMPMIGTIGKPIIVNIPDEEIDFAIKNLALIKFIENSKVTNIYIKNLFDSDYFENAISQDKRGGTQKFIALSDIRKLEIKIPPIDLQNQFAEIFQQIEKQKVMYKRNIKILQELMNKLMDKYF